MPTIFKGDLRGIGLHQVVQLAIRSFEGRYVQEGINFHGIPGRPHHEPG